MPLKHTRQVAKELTRKQEVLECAKDMVRSAGDDWFLSSQRYWLVEKLREEVIDLESKQMDLLCEINCVEKKIQLLEMVIERQSSLKKKETKHKYGEKRKASSVGCF